MGLRQEDSLSSFLSVLVIDIFARLLALAGEESVTDSTGHGSILHCCSIYADDVVLFMSPTTQDIQAHLHILRFFGTASGLCTNLDKCVAVPISCSEEHIGIINDNLPCGSSFFPIQYLGVPLTVGKLHRDQLQPLIDKVTAKLPIWQGKMISKPGRATLVKLVLSSTPLHTLISIAVPLG